MSNMTFSTQISCKFSGSVLKHSCGYVILMSFLYMFSLYVGIWIEIQKGENNFDLCFVPVFLQNSWSSLVIRLRGRDRGREYKL